MTNTNEIINNVMEPEMVAENVVEVAEEVVKAADPKKLLNADFGKGMIAGALVVCGVKVLGPKAVKGGKKVGTAMKNFFGKKKTEDSDIVEGDAVEIVEEETSETETN